MTSNPIDLQRLLAEEPFVRSLAHSLVADEADDVVQQAYLLALEHRPEDLRQPRSWLARIVRNLVANHRRRNQRRDARHRNVATHERVPSSSDLAEGEERRRALVAAVDRLPQDQRTVVLLRYYEGMQPRRIAAELGIPVVTVSNRLHTALQTLRRRLDAQHGERRAWLLPLVPFAALPRAMPWRELAQASAAPALWMGVIAMTTKIKIAAAVAAVLTLALVWIAWPGTGLPDNGPPGTPVKDEVVAARGDLDRGHSGPGDAPRREAVAAPKSPAATTGSLLVHVRYADEPTAAAGLTVALALPGGDFRVGLHRAVTDAEGTARFEALPPGRVLARTNINESSAWAEVRAGASSECILQIDKGMKLTGVVVDGAGVPIGGAWVEAGMAGVSLIDAKQVAVTEANGTFVIRGCYTLCVVGARAAGLAASQLHSVWGKRGGSEHVRIVLSTPGGSVEGVVLAKDGSPVQDAVVRIGKGTTDGIMATDQGAAPLPAQVLTDERGRFLAVGVPGGTQPVLVRAARFAPWSGTCEVAVGLTVPVQVNLSDGVTCMGVVHTQNGEPANAAAVTLGSPGEFLQFRTKTSEDGTFLLSGLPTGEIELSAHHEELGKATARVRGEAGATVRCELELSNGILLRARLIDDVGPVTQAEIVCEAEDDAARWAKGAFVDEHGRFFVRDCPAGRRLTIRVATQEHLPLLRTGVDPLGGEIELKLARDTAPKARIGGRLLRPDGSAAAGETVQANRYEPRRYASAKVEGDGSFTIEVPAGDWHIQVQARKYPEIYVAALAVTSGEIRDVGTLQLTRGGTLVVRANSEASLHYLIFDTNERFVDGLYTPIPPLRSNLLAPGDYWLLVRGAGVAAQELPFVIHPERETELEVRMAAGVRQRVEFVCVPGTALPNYLEFEVRRAGKLVSRDAAEGEPGGPLAREIWLAPGSYSLATRNREPQTTASFTIGSEEGAPARVSLR